MLSLNGTDDEGLRRFPRQAFAEDVYVMDSEGFGFYLEAENLSYGGVYLKTMFLLSEGQEYFVRAQLPDGRVVCARGRVCRTHPTPTQNHAPGIAIAFEHVDALSRDVLESVTGS